MSQKFVSVAVVLVLGVLPTIGLAQAVDASLRKALERAGFAPEATPDGSARVRVQLPERNNRTQTLVFQHRVRDLAGFELRTVYTVVYRGLRRLAQQQLERLMLASMETEAGAYSMLRAGDEYVIVLSQAVPISLKSPQLKQLAESMARAADLVEQELTNADAF